MLHLIRICHGPNCNQRFANDLLKHAKSKAGDKATIEQCYCLGHCELGPNMVVDGEIVNHVTFDVIDEVIKDLK